MLKILSFGSKRTQEADLVAFDDVPIAVAAAGNVDTVLAVAGDQVVTDGVAGGSEELYAVAQIGEGGGASEVGTDAVAGDGIELGAVLQDHGCRAVAGYQIALAGCDAAYLGAVAVF